MRGKRFRRYLLPLLCYGAALVIYLALCTAALIADSARAADGTLAGRPLGLEELELVAFEPREGEEGLYVSTDADPRIFYQPGEPFAATGLRFAAQSRNKPGGEMVLYYKTGAQTEYPENQKIWARQLVDGSWYFELGQRRYTGLRLDPDSAGGVLWEVEGLWLEGKKPAWAYYQPSAQTWFMLLAAPAFAAALIRQCWRVGRAFAGNGKSKQAKTF